MDLLQVAADMRASGDVAGAEAVLAEAAPDYEYRRRTRAVLASNVVARLAGMRIDPDRWWRAEISQLGRKIEARIQSDMADAVLHARRSLVSK